MFLWFGIIYNKTGARKMKSPTKAEQGWKWWHYIVFIIFVIAFVTFAYMI
jgi:hypothetical protein